MECFTDRYEIARAKLQLISLEEAKEKIKNIKHCNNSSTKYLLETYAKVLALWYPDIQIKKYIPNKPLKNCMENLQKKVDFQNLEAQNQSLFFNIFLINLMI